MKIAYLSTFFPYGGFDSKYNSELFYALKEMHSVFPFTYYRRYPKILFPDAAEYDKPAIDHKTVPALRILDSLNPVSYSRSAENITDCNPDLFVTKYNSILFLPALVSITKKLSKNGIPAVCILNEWIEQEISILKAPLFHHFIMQFDGFLVSSQNIREKIKNINKRASVEVAWQPFYNNFGEIIDKNSAKRMLGFDENIKTILYPIMHHQVPDTSLVFDIADALPDDYRINIVTESKDIFELYHKIATNNKLKNKVRVDFQKFYDSDISVYFCAADIAMLIYKNYDDSTMLSLCSGFALPAITEPVSPYSEIVDAYAIGIIVDNKDLSSIVSELNRYFNSMLIDNYRNKIKAANKEMSWDKVAVKINRLYESIS